MKQWYSPAELADLNLPGLPNKRNRMVEIASNERWQERVNQSGEPLARKRAGRGGGFEYHVDLLPLSAKVALLEGLEAPSEKPLSPSVTYDWAWFDAQNQKTKDEAGRRFAIIQTVENYAQNLKISEAVWVVSREKSVSEATIWSWLKLVEGVALADRLPALAPRRKGGGIKAEIDPELWQIFKSDFLRPSAPTYAGCYERLKDVAKARGLAVPHVKTLQRKLEAEVDKSIIILRRQGKKSLLETLPAQQRTISALNALDLVVVDGHKWDVFAKFPSVGDKEPRIGRPISVVIQDAYSRKILACRTGEAETTQLTQLAFADVFRDYGIPHGALLDNGRAFASKRITGGAKTRFRFKIKETDPLGLLTSLGIKTHWATPAHGQAKPIERAFRDLEETICRHPLCEGAYTGNHIDAKPENYGSRAIDIDVFKALIAKGIEAHNAKLGRRTEAADGASFDIAFNASYQMSAIGKATPEQMRLALLWADEIKTNRKTGAIMLGENRYWCADLQKYAGDEVTIRFDGDDLMQPVHVYKKTGEYICAAPIVEAVGFLDIDSAKNQAKLKANLTKKAKALAEAQELIDAHKLAAMMPNDIDGNLPPKPQVLRPIRARNSNTQPVLQELKSVKNAHLDAFVAAMDAAAAKEKAKPKFTIFDGGLAAKNGGQNP